MSAIVDFLRARLDEQTRAATVLAADDGHDVNCGSNHNLLVANIGGSDYFEVDSNDLRRDAEAKRALVDDLSAYCWEGLAPGERKPCGKCDRIGCRNLRRMAAVYAYHPDFRAEWAPETGE